MSNKNNINVWNLVNTSNTNNLNNKKKKIIINDKQKYKNIQYKTSEVTKRHTEFNFNKSLSVNALKYLTFVDEPVISNNYVSRSILRSIEYNYSFINNLNYTMWIDTSNLSSVFRDGNNNVYKILDKSGNNNHLYQNVKTKQPKYHNGGLLFNDNQYLISNEFIQGINNMSLFIVMKQYNQTSGIISGYSANSTGDINNVNAWGFTGSDSSTYQYKFNSNQGTNAGLANLTNITKSIEYGVYEIIINNNVGSLYYNGNLITTDSFSGLGNFTNVVLGARFAGSNTFNQYLTGEIYEVILLNTPTDNGDRYKIEKYLLDKWSTTQISRTIPISNVYTWLDASSKNNFTLDANNNVLAWNDKNFKLNFTQSNPTYYPVFDTNKVIFDGSYLRMTDTEGLDLNNFSIFYVFEELSHTNNAGLLSCINTLGDTDDQVTSGFALSTPSSNTINLGINSINLNYTDTSLGKKLYEFNVDNGVGTIYINGVVQNIVNYGTLGTSLRFAIGARQNNSIFDVTNPLNANIYEIIILNTSASYEQRNQIYSYLNEKWDIPCILSSPSPNSTFWLDSNNSSSITVDGSNNILTWNDLSSNSYPVTINTSPVLSTVDNLDYASFNGSDLNINFGTTLTGNNFALYVVFSADNMTTNDSNLINFGNDLNINSGDNTGYIKIQNQNFTINFDNQLYLLSIINNNNVWSIYINNYLMNSVDTVNNYSFSSLNIGGVIPWKGYINEILLYTDSLDSDSNFGTINYLSNKWSIQINSSDINEYLERTPTTTDYRLILNNIFFDSKNYLTTRNDGLDINLNLAVPITKTVVNQLNITSDDIMNLTVIDINIVYNVNPVVENTTINLPVLSYDNDYYAFNNISTYSFTVTGPNSLNYVVSPNTTVYFTNNNNSFTNSPTFQGYVCTLNQYSNINSNTFTIYIGGWSKNNINKLYLYSTNNVLLSTNIIYFNESYQVDFTLNIAPGTYTLIVSDIQSTTGNLINYQISTPIIIIDPTATLDHYINGSSSYMVTLSYWSNVYSMVTTLDVWVSTSSDYSSSSYLLTTDTIVNTDGIYSTFFTNIFANGFYWITLKSGDIINIQVQEPIIVYPAFSFSLDNTTHLTNNYNIILGQWDSIFSSYIPTLYIYAYLNSDYSDVPIMLVEVNTSEIVNTSGVYTLPFTYEFDIARNYYLSVTDSLTFDIFNIELTNNISKLAITGTIDQTLGTTNTNNVFTITLSNPESYDLSAYNSQWTIFVLDNNTGTINSSNYVVTTTTINSSQEITFSYNPDADTTTKYFYVGNSTIFVGI